MKSILLVTVLSAACLFVGCDKKADATAELEKAAQTIQQTEVPAPAEPQATPQPSQAGKAQPAQEMNQALASFKAGQLEDAVTRLQRLRATQALTPEQRIALNDAMAAVMNEISAQAAQGDQRAIQALRQYEQMRNQRR